MSIRRCCEFGSAEQGGLTTGGDPLVQALAHCACIICLVVHRLGMVDGHIRVKVHQGKVGVPEIFIRRHAEVTSVPEVGPGRSLEAEIQFAMTALLSEFSLAAAGRCVAYAYGAVELTVKDRAIHDLLFCNRVRPEELGGVETLGSCGAMGPEPDGTCPAPV